MPVLHPEQAVGRWSGWALPDGLSAEAGDVLKDAPDLLAEYLGLNAADPGGYCRAAVELLARHLHAQQIDVQALIGVYSPQIPLGCGLAEMEQLIAGGEIDDEAIEYGGHCWLEVEGLLVDPTAGQFVGEDALNGALGDPGPWNPQNYFAHYRHHGPFRRGWFHHGWRQLGSWYDLDWRNLSPASLIG